VILVDNPGMFTTVQDKGRWGCQAYGVSVAGAMDRFAYQTANLLAGNVEQAAALEMTLLGGSFRFAVDCYAALAGADMLAELNGISIANWSSFFIPAGSELAFGYAAAGCRAYLAIHGGIDVPVILGSRATYTRAAIGGLDGRALKRGDLLKIGAATDSTAAVRSLAAGFIPHYTGKVTLRVLAGPQDDLFTAEGIETFFNSVYTISSDADRMGYRLEGPVIEQKGKADIVSDALCQGGIQVPGHGMPIIMMADRQTTGGYSKIAAVIGPDLSLLAQAKPGDSVCFTSCTEEAAVQALHEETQRYREIKTYLAGCDLARHTAGQTRNFRVAVNGQAYTIEIREMDD
jgi:biotin-dependent carboxylase-like uncharacterized protein